MIKKKPTGWEKSLFHQNNASVHKCVAVVVKFNEMLPSFAIFSVFNNQWLFTVFKLVKITRLVPTDLIHFKQTSILCSSTSRLILKSSTWWRNIGRVCGAQRTTLRNIAFSVTYRSTYDKPSWFHLIHHENLKKILTHDSDEIIGFVALIYLQLETLNSHEREVDNIKFTTKNITTGWWLFFRWNGLACNWLEAIWNLL